MTTVYQMSLEQTEALLSSYAQAWNGHDVSAILAMHDDAMTFQLHLEGFDEVRGATALGELFGYFFDALPDYRAEVERVTVRGTLVALDYTISAILAQPFPVGDLVGLPSGKPMRIAALDVIRCSSGLVLRKDTFLDETALRAGLGL